MSNWLKIRNSLYTNKIREIDVLFNKLEESIKNGSFNSIRTFKPFEEWTSSQVLLGNNVRLSIQEYLILNNILNNFKESITVKCSNSFLKESREYFKVNYLRLISKKDEELKLEFLSEVIVKKRFPIGLVENIYANIPEEQFNEAMGEFWGDVWNPALKAGGYGAAAGLVSPVGPVGGFATGAALGGLYGAGKHLLNKVWNAHKNQSNFVSTKDDALKVLKRLQYHSNKAGIKDDKYHQTLNDLINHLSGNPQQVYPTPEEMNTIKKVTHDIPAMAAQPKSWDDWGKQEPVAQPSAPSPREMSPEAAAKQPSPVTPKEVPPTPSSKEAPPEAAEHAPQGLFSSWGDIVQKIGSANVDALLDGKMDAISNSKVKNLIMLVGEAIKNIVGGTTIEPEKLKLISLEQLNKAMSELDQAHEDMDNPFGSFSDLTKGKFSSLAQAYISNVINKLARRAGELKRLGIKKRVPTRDKPATAFVPTPEETPSTAPVAGAVPAPESSKEEPVPKHEDISDDLSEFERDIHTRLSSRDLLELLLHTFYSGNRLAKVKGTPLMKMLEDEKVGPPGSKKRLSIISSLREIFNKDKIREESDFLESVVEKYKRLLREGVPIMITNRAKDLPIEERVKFYKEQLSNRVR